MRLRAISMFANWSAVWLTAWVILAQQPLQGATALASKELGVTARLVQRIDDLIADASVGPSAKLCSDEDFLRRIYLDLWGTIPSAEQARSFLNDEASDRRDRLVDSLLAAPQYAQHMAYVVDVWLMERRLDKGIAREEWHAYLYESFARRKPFDQLVRELIAADGTDGEQRARAKLLLDRECNPHTLVRDVSRIFLGRDLQCAQCHDHPLVDDYLQREYFGMMSLLQRSYVFTDAEKENKTYIGERGDGLPEFRSVFIENDAASVAIAHIAGKPPIDVPLDNVGSEYVVAPADKSRGVPKFSVRAELASHTTLDNRQFDRTIANRWWSHMLGRGLVEPLDMHHSDNPPTDPRLLKELASGLRELRYDIRELLSAIAKTRVYQCSIDPPSVEQIVSARDEAEHVHCETATEVEQRKVAVEACQAELQAAATARDACEAAVQTQLRLAVDLRAKLVKGLADKAKARGELDETNKKLAEERAAAELVDEAAEKAQAALEKLADDPQVKSASASLTAKAAALHESIAKLTAKTEELQGQIEQFEQACQQHRPELTAAQQELAKLNQPFKKAHQNWLDHLTQRDFEKAAWALARRRQRQAERLLQLADLASRDDVDSAEIDRAFDALHGDWSALFAVANPRPLSPEQLAWCSWQATGHLQIEYQAAKNEWAEQHPTPSNLDPTTAAQRQDRSAREVRRALVGRMSAAVNQFAKLFGGGPGQVQIDFYATADQALFLANSGTIHTILSPQDDNLSARLQQLESAKAVANELYLSILSRTPSPPEQAVVSAYLTERGDQKDAAVRELAWSLLTSAEFRFYR